MEYANMPILVQKITYVRRIFFVTKLLTLKGRTPDISGATIGKHMTIHNLQYLSFPKRYCYT